MCLIVWSFTDTIWTLSLFDHSLTLSELCHCLIIHQHCLNFVSDFKPSPGHVVLLSNVTQPCNVTVSTDQVPSWPGWYSPSQRQRGPRCSRAGDDLSMAGFWHRPNHCQQQHEARQTLFGIHVGVWRGCPCPCAQSTRNPHRVSSRVQQMFFVPLQDSTVSSCIQKQ